MKKHRFLMILPLCLLAIVSCSEQTKYSTYACPMQCEGEKTYTKPGQCPVCEMELTGVETSKK